MASRQYRRGRASAWATRTWYVNIGTATKPDYVTYGGGGTAAPTASTTYTDYDYYFMYPSGTYYYGVVVDNGTYGYKVGESMSKDGGTYTIYGSSPTAAGNYQAGYNYMTEYVAGGQTYTPSDLKPGTPSYGQPAGYGGLGSEKSYVSAGGSYYAVSPTAMATQSTPVTMIPPLT